jgi:hypothetical protein|tara:strand:+ start:3302 stop:3547 length:246 start_codon:yes stop_codon:yes gene_type:complete
MNLYYIRAAIRENTGQVLTFAKIRQLLLEEGLISQSEIDQNPMAKEFEGYGRYFYTEECSVDVIPNPEIYVPELLDESFDD